MKVTKTETIQLVLYLLNKYPHETLASKMQVSLKTIHNWKTGGHLPRWRDLLRLRRMVSNAEKGVQ